MPQPDPASDEAPSVDIEQKVAFLKQPSSYPETPARVDVEETHMAWVFMTDRHAYKLKKPVVLAFLDYSTLAARREACEAEVRLNRRLAGAVYRGRVALVVRADGTLALDEDGEPVDWLVKMRRLPEDRMLDRMIEEGAVREADVRRVARHLARFYRDTEPLALPPEEYRARLEEDVRRAPDKLSRAVYPVPTDLAAEVAAAQQVFLDQRPECFDQRVAEGHVVEAHGDLRPEHICLTEEPVVFDCLEFDRSLRVLDAASELAFLGMECERLGASWIGDVVFEIYETIAGDVPLPELLHFYKSHWACNRAVLAVQHTVDRVVEDIPRWSQQADEYLRLAKWHVERSV